METAILPAPRYFSPCETGGGRIRCGLCPRRCLIAPGGFGNCGVRRNRNAAGDTPFSGVVTAMAADPIEKKPLYHFRPGSSVFSIGFAGCNLQCPFCQNWRISQRSAAAPRLKRLSPAEVTASARSMGLRQIAYTYSEPLVHFEFLLDCMKLAREAGIANIIVSNGCVNKKPAAEILALTDAANIDLKAFSKKTYSSVLGGDLQTVLAFIEAAHAAGVHLEITTLVVPGLNDSAKETADGAAFIAGVSRDIPWHLSAYHPDYRWAAPPTNKAALIRAVRRAREILHYVYIGNISGGPDSQELHDTLCLHCGRILISRRGYKIDVGGLVQKEEAGGQSYCCAYCGAAAPIVS